MTTDTAIGKDMEKLEPLYVAGGNIKLFRYCRKSLVVPQNDYPRLTESFSRFISGYTTQKN